jgi:hypothetical protein
LFKNFPVRTNNTQLQLGSTTQKEALDHGLEDICANTSNTFHDNGWKNTLLRNKGK